MQLIVFLVLLFIMFFGFISGAFISGAAAVVGLVAMCVEYRDD